MYSIAAIFSLQKRLLPLTCFKIGKYYTVKLTGSLCCKLHLTLRPFNITATTSNETLSVNSTALRPMEKYYYSTINDEH